jgi:FR47-like protein
MLGYILNRESCPGAKNVRFLTSPGHVCVARIEEEKEKASISLCVYACETCSQGGTYETAVLEIMEVHLQPSTTKLDIGTVPKGRVSSWIAGLEQNSWSLDTEDFIWFLEDSEVRSCSRASHDLASVVNSRLSASDAPLVNKHWPFGGFEGCSYIQRMIEGFPSTCLRPVTKNDLEPPVAWILSYPYGALGPLHVLDEYRRKGLGSWLILSLCEFMRSLAVREGLPCPRILCFCCEGQCCERIHV